MVQPSDNSGYTQSDFITYLDSLVEVCRANERVTLRLYDFLVRHLGKEAVSEIPHLSDADQVKAIIEHLKIGAEVGDITPDEIDRCLHQA